MEFSLKTLYPVIIIILLVSFGIITYSVIYPDNEESLSQDSEELERLSVESTIIADQFNSEEKLEVALNEAKVLFETEKQAFSLLDGKGNTLIGLLAIVTTLLAGFISFGGWSCSAKDQHNSTPSHVKATLGVVALIATLLFSLSFNFALQSTWVTNRGAINPDAIYDLNARSTQSINQYRVSLLSQYLQVYKFNKSKNKEKANLVSLAQRFAFLGGLAIFILSFLFLLSFWVPKP